MSDPADLGVVEAAALLARRELSALELAEACLARIEARDGRHSREGDPASINAWVRVYADDALAAARRSDERLAAGDASALCGIPIGLKDLYAVAGKPLTASSSLLDELPQRDCDAWRRLREAGMVLLGHLHTHEFAVGGTTDQVGNPWALDRSAGGSSGGSAAALAARMVPAATGTDTAGSLRIPSARCGTSTIKPTRGLVSLRGIVPLSPSLDTAGPMARTLADCALLLRGLAGPDPGRATTALAAALPATEAQARPLAGLRFAVSPRVGVVAASGVECDADVAGAFEDVLATVRRLGGTLVDAAPPAVSLDLGDDFLDVLRADLLVYHRRFDGRRDEYRPSLREWVESGELHPVSAEGYAAAQARRRETAASWQDWFASADVFAVLEPTVPIVARPRGDGYEHAGTDYPEISLTHYWNWTGAPVVALPSGLGRTSGLPTGVSLIGPAGSDWALLEAGMALQAELGVPSPV
jgi:aspartyl-tRNA(Asn)/glutamyl-tRNA(Gln) amidotransferase subunit A